MQTLIVLSFNNTEKNIGIRIYRFTNKNEMMKIFYRCLNMLQNCYFFGPNNQAKTQERHKLMTAAVAYKRIRSEKKGLEKKCLSHHWKCPSIQSLQQRN